MTGCVSDRLSAIGRPALAEDVTNVAFHGVDADYQVFGNHWVAPTSCNQAQHFQLPLRNAVWE